MGPSYLLNKKCRRLAALLTELLNKEHFPVRFITTSSCRYVKKKKNDEYEHVNQEKYGDLIRCLTSCKDGSRIREEGNKLYEAVSPYKSPALEAELKIPGNWIPLKNPDKSCLPQKIAPGAPLQISLQRNKVASVTSVLQQTMPLEQAFYLERWKQQMILELGKEGFAEYTKSK